MTPHGGTWAASFLNLHEFMEDLSWDFNSSLRKRVSENGKEHLLATNVLVYNVFHWEHGLENVTRKARNFSFALKDCRCLNHWKNHRTPKGNRKHPRGNREQTPHTKIQKVSLLYAHSSSSASFNEVIADPGNKGAPFVWKVCSKCFFAMHQLSARGYMGIHCREKQVTCSGIET